MVSAFDKNSGKTPPNKENASQNTENRGAPVPVIKAEDTSVKAESASAKTVQAPSSRAQKAAAKAAEKTATAEAEAPEAGAPEASTPKASTSRRSLVSPSPTRPTAGITFAELHKDFLRARRVEGIRPTTLRTYRGSLLLWASGALQAAWILSGRS